MMNEMYGMFTILSQLTADSAIGFCKLSHSFNKSKNVQRILALLCKNQWLIHWDKQKRIYGKITLFTYSNIFAFVLFCLSWAWIHIAVISQAVQRRSSPTANSFPLFASTFVSIILLHKLKFWIKYRGCWEYRNHIKKRKRKGVHNLSRWVPLKQSPILEHNLSGCTCRPGKKSVRHIPFNISIKTVIRTDRPLISRDSTSDPHTEKQLFYIPCSWILLLQWQGWFQWW